jgi:membrane protein YqaA with SNARE-associated domain
VVLPAFDALPVALQPVLDSGLSIQPVLDGGLALQSLPWGAPSSPGAVLDAAATTGADATSVPGVQEQTTNATTTGGTAEGGSDGWLDFGWIQTAVETATGWAGLGIIAVYSFLIAFVLPLPSEVVLLAPLDVGLPWWFELSLIIVVSGLGKAGGSVFAFHIGQEAKEAGPVIRFLRRSRFDVIEWSEAKTIEIARKYGYAGLAMALCVPGFPDTLSIYAFSILEEDYVKFALATFAGSVGRLVLWEAGVEAITIFL